MQKEIESFICIRVLAVTDDHQLLSQPSLQYDHHDHRHPILFFIRFTMLLQAYDEVFIICILLSASFVV